MSEVAVLVVGGGPVGLSLGLRLGQLGVPVTLVERRTGTATFPRGRALSVRTMEIYRSWGLEDEITAVGLPRDQLVFYSGRSLTDPNGTRHVVDPAARPLPSPTYTLLCSQDRLEPLLRHRAESQAGVDVRFGTELVELEPGPASVTARMDDGDVLQARFVVAADGATSGVRSRLGIAMEGPSDVSHNLNILFEADLANDLTDRRSAVYTISRPDLHGTFLAVDNDRRWLFNLVADGSDPGLADLDDAACIRIIREAAGRPDLEPKLVDRHVWRAAALVADHFQAGRIFLAGDAAHVTTPYGGFGLNLGVADADNLAWKLAAVHHDRAGEVLLDTYEQERRPVAVATAAESHQRLRDAIDAHCRGEPPPARASEGLTLGYHYTSAAVVPDGTAPPEADPVTDYVPTGRPGHQLPHAWLRAGVSTLDLAGPGFALLLGPAAPPRESTQQVVVRRVGDPAVLALLGLSAGGALLVRPDGHVAWRMVSATPTRPIRWSAGAPPPPETAAE